MWKDIGYGSEQITFGDSVVVVKVRPVRLTKRQPPSEYEFDINGVTSEKRFADKDEAKRIAIASARNRIQSALQDINNI